MARGEDIPFKLHPAPCSYVMCSPAEGHELCQFVLDWIRELGAAVEAGDLEKAREIWKRLKRP